MKKSALFIGAVALILASCSHHEYDGPDYVGGKLTVTGSINQVITRANGVVWDAGDAIGLSSDAGHDNIRFTTETGDGIFTSATPVYVLGSGTTTFTAYHPHSPEISADVPEITFSTPQDYMWATATATRDNPQANFVFKHQMAKISITLTDKAAGAAAGGTISLNGIATSGKFHTLTGEVTADNTKANVSKDFVNGKVADFILPAQKLGAPVQIIVVYNDKIYGGSITLATLEQGNEYHYNIDLTNADPAAELSISSATITDWNKNEGGNIDMTEQEPERQDNVLEVGDFLLADGTTLDKNDPTFATYKKDIVGVVYYVGNPQPSVLYSYNESQDVLRKDAPTAINGLAIALTDANGGETARLAATKYNFSTWYQPDSKDAGTANPNYIGTNLSLTKAGERMLGYNNTKIFEAATNDVGADLTGVTDLLNLIAGYNASVKVNNASQWYLPSYAELAALIANYNTIKASVEKAGGTLNQFPDYTKAQANGLFYWTSDMRGSDNEWVSPLINTTEDVFVGKNSNGTKGYFRLSIAF